MILCEAMGVGVGRQRRHGEGRVLAFRVRLNRTKVATAGIPGAHVLSAIVTSVTRDRAARRLWPRDRPFRKKELTLHLGGMISHRDGAREHVEWANLNLKAGDTVTLTVVETGRIDEPTHRRTTDGPTVEASERRALERLQRKYRSRDRPLPSTKTSPRAGRRASPGPARRATPQR